MITAEDLWSFERDLAQFFPQIHPDHGFVRHLEAELEHEVTHWHQMRAWLWGAAVFSLIVTGGVALLVLSRYYRRLRREIISAR